MALSENDWREVLEDALKAVKGIVAGARDKLLDEYAPRLAGLSAAESPSAAAQEFDDIMVNVKLVGRIAGIRGETAAVRTVINLLKLAAGVAKKVAVV